MFLTQAKSAQELGVRHAMSEKALAMAQQLHPPQGLAGLAQRLFK